MKRKGNKATKRISLRRILIVVLCVGVMVALLSKLYFVIALAAFLLLKVTFSYCKNNQKAKLSSSPEVTRVDNMTGDEFEHYISKLLEHQGYKAVVTRQSGDLGADIIASRGSTKYAVQVKRWKNNVPRNAVSDAVGSMAHYSCNAAMVVTNSYFTAGAKQLAQSNRCDLIDRDALIGWMSNMQKYA